MLRRPRIGIAALDVLRGLAILGTFGANVCIFALPGGSLSFAARGYEPAESSRSAYAPWSTASSSRC